MEDILDQYERRFACGIDREEVLACVEALPAMPKSSARVLGLIDDCNADTEQVAEAVGSDTGLVASVLRMANSANFAQERKVIRIDHAVGVIGLLNLKSLVMAATLRQMSQKTTPLDKLIWRNSAATAVIARAIATQMGRRSTDDVFLLGILHRLGQFVLLAHPRTRQAYSSVLLRIKDKNLDLADAELEQIGFTHTLLGALAASRWNLPGEVAQVLLRYRDPIEGVETDLDHRTAVIKLADLAAESADLGRIEGQLPDFSRIGEAGYSLGVLPDAAEETVVNFVADCADIFASEGHLLEA